MMNEHVQYASAGDGFRHTPARARNAKAVYLAGMRCDAATSPTRRKKKKQKKTERAIVKSLFALGGTEVKWAAKSSRGNLRVRAMCESPSLLCCGEPLFHFLFLSSSFIFFYFLFMLLIYILFDSQCCPFILSFVAALYIYFFFRNSSSEESMLQHCYNFVL